MQHFTSRSLRPTALLMASASLLLPVAAQAQAPAEANPGEIVVTARKQEEKITDIPLSIQAFSAADLAESGVSDLQDLSRFTPSLNFVNGTQGQGGRVISEVRFRGLSTNLPTPTNQTGSAFVDGIFVLGGAQSLGFEDIERVEVIKGPQAAYFGRSTFGGAVNYITRDPAESFGGAVSGSFSPSFNSYSYSRSVEGPLIGDVLLARLSASTREKGAQYRASDGGELGKEHTDAVNLTLLFKPAPGLRVKLRGSYVEDNDSAPMTGYLSFNDRSNCPVGTPFSVLTNEGRVDAKLSRALYCGNIPYDASIINTNTNFVTLPAELGLPALNIYDVLVNNLLNDPILAQAPRLKRFGMTRWMIRLSGSLDYDISDQFSLTVAGGYNKQKSNTIRDIDGTVRMAGYQAVPLTFEDYSAEARLRFDSGSWLKASVGFNYFRQNILADTDNGVSIQNQSQTGTVITRNATRSVNNENDKINTKGVFFGADITPIDWATLTLEGRYQVDDYSRFGGSNAAGNLIEQKLRSKNFTPRAILSVRPVQDMTLYATYSLGVLPGAVNSGYLALTPAQQADVRAAAPNLQVQLDSQKLKNFEVGYKQYFRDLGLTVSLAAFKMDWENLQGSSAVIVTSLSNPVFSVTVPGQARIKGLEFESLWQATRQLNLRVAAGYLDAKYIDYAQRGSNAIFGLPSTGSRTYIVNGNTLPRNPKVTASGSATWIDHLTGDWDYRLRGDLIYSGKQYISETNLTSLAGYAVFNLTVGVQTEQVSVELFARNLFNKRAWLNGRNFVDVSAIPLNFAAVGQGAFLTPIDKREVGLSVSYKF